MKGFEQSAGTMGITVQVSLCRLSVSIKIREVKMGKTIAYAGVPTSLGSYSPGQEKAPQAFRDACFLEMLREQGLTVLDCGDLPVRRWRPDKANLFAQHWEAVVACVQQIDAHLSEPIIQGHIPVVIGGTAPLS